VPLEGRVFDRPVHRGGEGVRHASDEQAERVRPAIGSAQVSGLDVGLILQLFGGPSHPGDGLFRHVGFAVDDPGDGLDSHSGEVGDVLHRGPPTGCAAMRLAR